MYKNGDGDDRKIKEQALISSNFQTKEQETRDITQTKAYLLPLFPILPVCFIKSL